MSTDLKQLIELALTRTPCKIEAMSTEERRSYNAKAAREARQRRKATKLTGTGMPSLAITRDIMADIAIMILATDAEGSSTIMTALEQHYADRRGFPIQIRANALRGKLKPKIIIRQAQASPGQTG